MGGSRTDVTVGPNLFARTAELPSTLTEKCSAGRAYPLGRRSAPPMLTPTADLIVVLLAIPAQPFPPRRMRGVPPKQGATGLTQQNLRPDAAEPDSFDEATHRGRDHAVKQVTSASGRSVEGALPSSSRA